MAKTHVLPLPRSTPNIIVRLGGDRIGIILTTRRKVESIAIIDSVDYPIAKLFRWTLVRRPHTTYAKACGKLPDGSRTQLYLHRLIANAKTGELVDHRDGQGLLNVRSNVRICTRSENQQNRRPQKNATSRFKGVSRFRDRWVSFIRIPRADGTKGKKTYLGRFPFTPEGEVQAALCYDKAATRYHKAFKRLNFPQNGFLSLKESS